MTDYADLIWTAADGDRVRTVLGEGTVVATRRDSIVIETPSGAFARFERLTHLTVEWDGGFLQDYADPSDLQREIEAAKNR